MGLAFEQREDDTFSFRAKDLEDVINKNMGWFTTVLNALRSNAISLAIDAAELFISPHTLPTYTYVNYSSSSVGYSFYADGRYLYIYHDSKTGTPTIDYDENDDPGGVLADFISILASDPSVLRRILENYYSIARAVLVLANEFDDDNVKHAAERAADAMSAIESLYIDIFGESIIPDEETVGKLVKLYRRVYSYNKYTSDALEYVRDVIKRHYDFGIDIRYADRFDIGDLSLFLEMEFSTSKVSVKVHVFHMGKHLASFSVSSDGTSDKSSIRIRYFESLDTLLGYIPAIDEVFDSLARIYDIVRKAMTSFLTSNISTNFSRPLTLDEMDEIKGTAERYSSILATCIRDSDPNDRTSCAGVLAGLIGMVPWQTDAINNVEISFAIKNYRTDTETRCGLILSPFGVTKIYVAADQYVPRIGMTTVVGFEVNVDDIYSKEDVTNRVYRYEKCVLADFDATNFKTMATAVMKIERLSRMYDLIHKEIENILGIKHGQNKG